MLLLAGFNVAKELLYRDYDVQRQVQISCIDVSQSCPEVQKYHHPAETKVPAKEGRRQYPEENSKEAVPGSQVLGEKSRKLTKLLKFGT